MTLRCSCEPSLDSNLETSPHYEHDSESLLRHSQDRQHIFGDSLHRNGCEPLIAKGQHRNYHVRSHVRSGQPCKVAQNFDISNCKASGFMSRCGAACTVHTGSPTLVAPASTFFFCSLACKIRPVTSNIKQRNQPRPVYISKSLAQAPAVHGHQVDTARSRGKLMSSR